MMFYGIERTTDMRHPETKVVQFRARKTALDWAKASGQVAWEGAAQKTISRSQQNWHRRFRSVYEMPHGWRKPSKKAIESKTSYQGSYWTNSNDVVANAIHAAGVEIT